MLNVFQEGELTCAAIQRMLIRLGRSHMAIVSRRPRRVENDPEDVESVMTAAAGGLGSRFMRKVAEISHGGKSASDSSGSDSSASEGDEDHKKRNRQRTKKARKSNSSGSSPTAVSREDQLEVNKKAQEAETKTKGITQVAKLTQLEQTVPADAQMPPAMVEKVCQAVGSYLALRAC